MMCNRRRPGSKRRAAGMPCGWGKAVSWGSLVRRALAVSVLYAAGCDRSAQVVPCGSDDPGLAHRVAPSTAPAPATRPGPYMIYEGQKWSDAEAVARAAGYRLHDARGLAWASAGPKGELGIDGFYVRLPGDVDLIVFRDREDDSVDGLHLVANASKPKSQRTHPEVGKSLELPPPDENGR